MNVINEQTLLDMLAKDYIGRNSQLSTLIKFINSFDDSATLAIDSSWGSGKTVFVKQLELLNQKAELADMRLPSIDTAVLQTFREKYSVYYFNSWENDFLDDPLQALMYNLINDLSTSGPQDKVTKKTPATIDILEFVKNISKDGIDLAKLTSPNKAIEEIKTIIDRKQHVHKLLGSYLDKSEKKLLFIIDELDRCKPSFAVNLLEVVKHYFIDKDIVFVVATNNTQLAHTVCKYYGSSFDGAAYLNKFFDYTIHLSREDKEKYISGYLKKPNNSTWNRLIPADIAENLGMSMREIESYFRALELVSGYMSRESVWRDGVVTRFCQWIFVPFALALKIVRPHDYKSFVAGESDTLLDEFALHSKYVIHLAERYVEDKKDFNSKKAAQLVIDTYRALFAAAADDYDTKEIRDGFQEIVNLISSYSTIKESEKDGSND